MREKLLDKIVNAVYDFSMEVLRGIERGVKNAFDFYYTHTVD